MEWFFPTNTFQAQTGHRERLAVDPASDADDVFARRGWEASARRSWALGSLAHQAGKTIRTGQGGGGQPAVSFAGVCADAPTTC